MLREGNALRLNKSMCIRASAGSMERCLVVEIGRVYDPSIKKYIKIVEGGVPSKFWACFNPTTHTIHLNKQKCYKSLDKYMDTCLHEAIHAAFPTLSEAIVTERTPILKRLLKKMGIGVDLG